MRRDNQIIIPLQGPTLGDTEAAADIYTQASEIECQSDEDYAELDAILHQVAGELKRLKAEMDETIRPINDGIKRLRALYRPAFDSLQSTDALLRKTMLAYRTRQEAARIEAERKAHAALQAGQHAEAMAHVQQAITQPTQGSSTQIRKRWCLRVTDITKVPAQYLQVDTVALRRDALARGWQNAPDGIEYYQEESIAVR